MIEEMTIMLLKAITGMCVNVNARWTSSLKCVVAGTKMVVVVIMEVMVGVEVIKG